MVQTYRYCQHHQLVATLDIAEARAVLSPLVTDETAFNRAFGRRIAKRRRERGMSQERLAGLIGLARTSVTNIEAGRQNVVAFTVHLLARHLEISADKLLSVAERAPAPAIFPDITNPAERAFVGRALASSEEEPMDDE
jgi:transcriptional regulator with XRE-family HTH domain